MTSLRAFVGLVVVLLATTGTGSPGVGQETQGLQVRGAMVGDALMVALRDVFPYLGFAGEWDGPSQSVLLRSNRGTLRATVGSTTATWYPAATGAPRRSAIAEPPEIIGGTVVGPLTSLLRAAGIAYVVTEATSGLTRLVVGEKTLTVLHGAQPEPGRPRPEQPSAPQPKDPNLTSRRIDSATPQLVMRNDSSRVVTIRLARGGQQMLWQLPPARTVAARPVEAGTWTYEASAPGVRASTGERTFEPYTEYTWKWWVQ